MKPLFDDAFIRENLMGPNALKLLEDLTAGIEPKQGMRVLDLGCGKGLTSMYLADSFGVQVFATDLWISATENHQRFTQMGFESRIIPIHADALALPYADEYFDAAVSVDAYQYFGGDAAFMDAHLAPLIKPGGLIAIAVPGVKQELDGLLPPEMALSWSVEDISTFHSCAWWEALLSKSALTEIVTVNELPRFDEYWEDWLDCDNEYAVTDRPAMRGGAGRYMNFVSMVCRRK
jgi:cyclopropane fatty-acyl-phospholipid synthase-like methyltransferase